MTFAPSLVSRFGNMVFHTALTVQSAFPPFGAHSIVEVKPINIGNDLLHRNLCRFKGPTRLAAGGGPEILSPGGKYIMGYFAWNVNILSGGEGGCPLHGEKNGWSKACTGMIPGPVQAR